MKLDVLIVDDEHSGRSTLKILLKQNYASNINKIDLAASLEEAIDLVTQGIFDVCFLDIDLNNRSGFELLPYLTSKTSVIFVTAYSEYAINAIREKAFDYLLKPLDPNELRKCIARYEKDIWVLKGVKYLLIKQGGESMPINFDEIEYLEGDGPYSKIFLTNGREYTTSKTLKILSGLLDNSFIRINKSYIINRAMIKSFKKDSLTTKSDKCLSVSRAGYKELLSHF